MRDRGDGGGPFGTDPVGSKGRLWFEEARRDSAREAAEVADWARRRKPTRDGAADGSSGSGDDDGGCGGDAD